MKTLARLIGVIVVGVGLVGIVMPDGLLSVGRSAATVPGLYTLAVLRVCVGIILLGASAASRVPRTLRVLGIVIIIAGLSTPLFGVERMRTIVEWAGDQGAMPIRLLAIVLVIGGALLSYAMSGERRVGMYR